MTSTKVDYRRELRELYQPGRRPELVDVPELSFLMIDGHGDPNTSHDYELAIQALYAVSYGAKFALKRSDGFDYAVPPLEGLWWSADTQDFVAARKSAWDWTMMIMQPPRVTAETIERARAGAERKVDPATLAKLRLERFAEGLSAQVMYLGPYSQEGPAIAQLHAFIAEQGYRAAGKHHEIYIGDPRRSAPEKLKTVIRQPVAPP